MSKLANYQYIKNLVEKLMLEDLRNKVILQILETLNGDIQNINFKLERIESPDTGKLAQYRLVDEDGNPVVGSVNIDIPDIDQGDKISVNKNKDGSITISLSENALSDYITKEIADITYPKINTPDYPVIFMNNPPQENYVDMFKVGTLFVSDNGTVGVIPERSFSATGVVFQVIYPEGNSRDPSRFYTKQYKLEDEFGKPNVINELQDLYPIVYFPNQHIITASTFADLFNSDRILPGDLIRINAAVIGDKVYQILSIEKESQRLTCLNITGEYDEDINKGVYSFRLIRIGYEISGSNTIFSYLDSPESDLQNLSLKTTSKLVVEAINEIFDSLKGKQDTLVSGENIKTLNGESLLGNGDITLDLTLYKVVSTLPTEDIDPNKIYLVLDTGGEGENIYKEYVYVNDSWEELGTYRATIDLTPYLTKEEASSLYATKSELQEVQNSVDGKQDTLVSGQNIKSIDGESLLGEGDIQIKYPMPGSDSPHFPDLCIKLDSEGQLSGGETIDTLKQKLEKGVTWILYDNEYYLIRSISWSDYYYWISAVNMGDINQILDISFNGITDPLVSWDDTKRFQLTEDNTLQTTSKTVPGAINELKSSVDDHTSKLPVVTDVPTLAADYVVPANATSREYIYNISVGATVYNIIGAEGIKWADGVAPIATANSTIVVSIMNNLAVWGTF